MNFTVDAVVPQAVKISITVDFQEAFAHSDREETLKEGVKEVFTMIAENLTMFFGSSKFAKTITRSNIELKKRLFEMARLSVLESFCNDKNSVPEELMQSIGLKK